MLHVPKIVLLSRLLLLVESRFGRALFAGIPIQFQFGINLATRVAVYFIETYQAGKIQIHKKIYPSKGEGTSTIREIKVEPNGREVRENVFQLSCCSEQSGLVLRFRVIKTHI